MIIIQHSNGIVTDILHCRDDATSENIVVATSIPAYTPQEGHNGVLKYGENGLYWDYEAVEMSNEISSEELQTMIEEVL